MSIIRRGEGMKQQDLLKIFHKYGFTSCKKYPYLYQNNNKCGIVYTLKTPYYGELTRVYFPKTLDDAEDFLAKFYWYTKNGEKNWIHVELTHYQSKESDILYFQNGKELSREELLHSKKEVFTENKKEVAFLKKMKRTFFLLVEVIEEKIKVQNETYSNLITLTNESIQKFNEKNEKLAKLTDKIYKKKKNVPIEPVVSYEDILNTWKEQIVSVEEKEELNSYIFELVDFLRKLELDEGFLKNKYELIQIPLQIDSLKEEIAVIDAYQSKKKGIFSKKENIEELLEQCKKKDLLKKIVKYDSYRENERKRILEKYEIIPDLDIRTIGDYFLEFDNLKIKEPIFEEEEKAEKKEASFEIVMTSLEKSFSHRKKEIQELLIAYFYLLKNVYVRDLEQRKSNVLDFMQTLQNPNNIMMKVKYFKDISLVSIDSCIQSIEKLISRVGDVEKDILKGTINVFWKDVKNSKNELLKVSSKRFLSPTQSYGDNQVHYLGKLEEDALVLFIPCEIQKDFYNGDNLVLEQGRPYFVIDLHDHLLEDSTHVIQKIVHYKIDTTTESGITIVSDLKEDKIELYAEVKIRRMKK